MRMQCMTATTTLTRATASSLPQALAIQFEHKSKMNINPVWNIKNDLFGVDKALGAVPSAQGPEGLGCAGLHHHGVGVGALVLAAGHLGRQLLLDPAVRDAQAVLQLHGMPRVRQGEADSTSTGELRRF